MYFLGGRDRGVRTWEKRGGEVYRRAGSRISKVVGGSRNRGKLCNTGQYFTIEKAQRGGSQENRARTGIKGNGKRVV